MAQEEARRMIEQAALDYIESVASGSRVVGELERAAVMRHLGDLERVRRQKRPRLVFDLDSARAAIEFFHQFLPHTKGEWAGQPFVLSGWQAFIVMSLFGWRQRDGRRRFRTAYLEVARKNGKTTLAAGLGLYLLTGDDEPGAEIYVAATKRDQARITHSEAVRMVKTSPALSSELRIFRDNLNDPATASKMEPLGADADTMDGLNVHAALVDEVHAHKTRDVWDRLDTATGSRRQPIMFATTSSGSSSLSPGNASTSEVRSVRADRSRPP
jgi:phage terminase large subunit-like protein